MFDFITSTDFLALQTWVTIFRIAKALFILFDIALVFAILYAFKRAMAFYPPFVPWKRIASLKAGASPEGAEPVSTFLSDEWGALQTDAAAVALDEGWTMILIRADKLADEALKRLGYEGNTMLERIQSLARTNPNLKTLEKFWRAHRLRNKLVHETGFTTTKNEARTALKGYGEFFKELGVL